MSVMWRWIFLYLCSASLLLPVLTEDKESTGLIQDASILESRPLLLATLGGGMVAVKKSTGDIIWELKDEPVVKVPEQDSSLPRFLPDPRHGSLYMYGHRPGEPHVLKKMPLTIPQLVSSAPCRSTDGILYTGKKTDTWFIIDPETGVREKISGFDTGQIFNMGEGNTCSLDKQKGVYLARTEYTILMQNYRSDRHKWNVTFFDYNSHDMGQEMLNDYGFIHFASASNGRVMSFDRKTGDLIWSRSLDTPVVAAYLLDRDGLIAVPFNSMGDNTMDHIMDDVNSLRHGRGLKNSNMELFPTLYVGVHNHGLYALSSLVDKSTATISTEQTRPLLIEGPISEEKDTNTNSGEYLTNVHYGFHDVDVQTLSTPFLLLGHYKMPETFANWFLETPKANVIGNYISGENRLKLIKGSTDNKDTDNETNLRELMGKQQVISIGVQTDDEIHSQIQYRPAILYRQAYFWINQQENKGLKVTLIILSGIVVTMFWYLRYQAREFQQLSQGGSRGSSGSQTSREATAVLEDLGDGETRIGKITFHTDQVLGKGCEGTFVYRGTFDKRAVAVKRLLPECFTFADREVALLRESDAHANVVRYYCTERDRQFRYIALELCAATLQDYIEKKLNFECNIDPYEILKQATMGLSHLHSMDIVHRDIKPHNVLLSVPSGAGEVRAMISDFGLSKKLLVGRTSFSRRSGVTGTDGWIAPEMINGERTTTSVDIFSLGCVFHYVLSGGRHPFGDVLRRQANILSDEYTIENIECTCPAEDVVLAKLLIRAMISARPHQRPPCKTILKSPLFWTPQTRLNFLQDVSDQLEGGGEAWGRSRLDARGRGAVRGDWRARVCERVAADLRARRSYRGDSVVDLLRAIRNKKNHYRELDPEVRDALGRIPDGFVSYWLGRFPLLLPHIWCHMQDYRDEDVMHSYYPHIFTFKKEDIPELNAVETYDDLPELCDPDKNQLFVKSRAYYVEGEDKRYRYKGKYSPRKWREDGVRERNVQNWRTEKRKEDVPVWTLPQ